MRSLSIFTKEKAQGIAEFAMILPLIIILIGMIITGGQFLFVKLSMQMAAYEGARAGVTAPNYSTANTEAKSKILDFTSKLPLINPNQVKVTTKADNGWYKGEPFTVTTSFDMKTLFPVPGTKYDKVNSTITVNAEIMLAIENANPR